MNKFYSLSPKDKIQILQATGEQVNLPAYAVEKDWWVVQTLAILFDLPIGKNGKVYPLSSVQFRATGWGRVIRFFQPVSR